MSTHVPYHFVMAKLATGVAFPLMLISEGKLLPDFRIKPVMIAVAKSSLLLMVKSLSGKQVGKIFEAKYQSDH